MSAKRVIQVSGKWSADDKVFARYLRECIEATEATHVLATECVGKGPEIRKAVPGFQFKMRGEFPIGVSKDHGELGNNWLAEVSNQFHGSSNWRDQKVHWCYVRDEDGAHLFGVTHFSSAVQAGDNWSGFRPGVMAHQSGASKIGATVARNEKRGIDTTLGADINLDLHRQRWRNYSRDEMNMACCWDKDRPKRGTHGSRLIDGIWSTAPIGHARIIGVNPPGVLDHRAVVAAVGKGKPRGDVSIGPIAGGPR